MSAQASIANVQGRARYLALPISAAAGKGQDPHAQLRPWQHPSPQPPTCTGAHRQAGPAPHCPAGTQTGARWSSGTCRHTCPEYTTLSSTSIAAPVGSLSLSLSLSLTHTHTHTRAHACALSWHLLSRSWCLQLTHQTRIRESASTARMAWSRASSHFSLLSLRTCCSFCRSMPSASAKSASFRNSPTAPQYSAWR